jgi:hypothetical protein
VRAVVALADEALEHAVLRGDRLELGQRSGLGRGRGKVQRTAQVDRRGHQGLDQRRTRGRADH